MALNRPRPRNSWASMSAKPDEHFEADADKRDRNGIDNGLCESELSEQILITLKRGESAAQVWLLKAECDISNDRNQRESEDIQKERRDEDQLKLVFANKGRNRFQSGLERPGFGGRHRRHKILPSL